MEKCCNYVNSFALHMLTHRNTWFAGIRVLYVVHLLEWWVTTTYYCVKQTVLAIWPTRKSRFISSTSHFEGVLELSKFGVVNKKCNDLFCIGVLDDIEKWLRVVMKCLSRTVFDLEQNTKQIKAYNSHSSLDTHATLHEYRSCLDSMYVDF